MRSKAVPGYASRCAAVVNIAGALVRRALRRSATSPLARSRPWQPPRASLPVGSETEAPFRKTRENGDREMQRNWGERIPVGLLCQQGACHEKITQDAHRDLKRGEPSLKRKRYRRPLPIAVKRSSSTAARSAFGALQVSALRRPLNNSSSAPTVSRRHDASTVLRKIAPQHGEKLYVSRLSSILALAQTHGQPRPNVWDNGNWATACRR